MAKKAQVDVALLIRHVMPNFVPSLSEKNATKVNKLVDTFDVVPVDADRKSALTNQGENLGYFGVSVSLCLSVFPNSMPFGHGQ